MVCWPPLMWTGFLVGYKSNPNCEGRTAKSCAPELLLPALGSLHQSDAGLSIARASVAVPKILRSLIALSPRDLGRFGTV